jgi:hypothetical protein
LEWVAFVKGLKVFDDPRAATYLRSFAAGTMAPAGGMVYDVQQGMLDEPTCDGYFITSFFILLTIV